MHPPGTPRILRRQAQRRVQVVDGRLPRIRARRVFERRAGQAKHCYGMVLGEDPGAKGKLVVDLAVRADGTVAEVDVRADPFGGRWHGCMHLKAWRFGVQKAPARIRYIMVFLPEA